MSIGEEQVECPLCMEPLEMDDINFFPCTCGYQICRFCWHRIRTDENGLCPACRKAYPEDPAQFKPLTEDELQRIKRERKIKDLQRKQKAAENRKHLANVRVVQKNLVFVVGLSQRLGDTEVLKKHDYFGKFGKIVKVVINQSTSYAGSQGPSASAYITYLKPEDALRAIQAVNNIHVDGRTIKASLGTTKYCSHFLRGTQCPKPDCMYLHELGDEAASFTKEEMQQGKHQEYEQKLYEQYMNHLNSVNLSNHQQTATLSNKSTNQTRKKSHSPATSQRQTPPQSVSQPQNTHPPQTHNTDAWPSLQTGQCNNRPPADRPTNGNKAPPPTTSSASSSTQLHSNNNTGPPPPPLANQGSVAAHQQPSASNHHKRNSSADLHSSNRAPGQQRQTHTPDGHITNRPPQMSENNSSSQTQQQQPPQSLVNNHSPPQLSPPQIQTPPTSVLTSVNSRALPLQAGGSGSSPNTSPRGVQQQQQHPQVTQPMAPQRKPLYGDSNTESMSLFSNSGFPVTRNPSKPLLFNPPHPASDENKLPGATEISDTISVSSATDWQAAFGFQPAQMTNNPNAQSMAPSMMNYNQQMMNHSSTAVSKQQQQSSLHDTSGDDDLGFDPWNESTKALQDLIEKEAVSSVPATSQELAQQQVNHMLPSSRQLPTQTPQMVAPDRTKPLPPGFMPNHVPSAFSQNPMLGGSRMMGLMKFPQQHQQTSGYPTGGMDPSRSDLPLGGMGLPPQNNQDVFNMKSWQEGLRALLPNINIHFESPHGGSVGGMMGVGPQFQQQQQQTHVNNLSNHKPSQVQQQQQQRSDINNSWDLSYDPAILTSGNISDTNNMEEPHWMASLHHLTEETPSLPTHQQPLPHSSRFLPLGIRHAPQAPAPPPGFQNTIRPPPQMAGGALEPHKLMDGFQ